MGDIPEEHYTLLHFDHFISLPKLKRNEGNVKQFMENNQHEAVQNTPFRDNSIMRDSIELLHKVRNISDAELQTSKRQYLPVIYRQMTDAKLRRALGFLDTRIFKMAITTNRKRPYTKTEIQKTLGIQRKPLDARFKAILKRLEIPSKRARRWYHPRKCHTIYRPKRTRRKLPFLYAKGVAEKHTRDERQRLTLL